MNEINYSVSFEKPYTHYCEVEINLNHIQQDSVIFVMPVWTPGSYLIREFAKNVEDVIAENSDSDRLSLEKINKNSWKVDTKNQSDIKFRYKVYCNEFSVRTSIVNSEHAFLSNAGIFMFVKEHQDKKCIIKINTPAEWKTISTGLEKLQENIYEAENYDILADSPIEIGNQKVLEFEINEIKHFICLSGEGNFEEEIILRDFKKIAEEEIKLFRSEIPYKHYTFIIHIVQSGSGGLEHLNSFVAQISRWNFRDEKLYKKFLGLVAHEFFHLWNVKRIRPEVLGPFDYEKENYTKGLWVSEGWTNFYDNLILKRSDLINMNEYLEFVDSEINDIMRFKGRFVQSLAESSYDTWIKHYRPDENSVNSRVSYYTKGSLTAVCLNIEIIKNTNSEKSLDDVLRLLYEEYKNDNSKGFSDKRLKEICEAVNGNNLDLFWTKYITGTEDLPLDSYLNLCGLELINENDLLKSSLDIESKEINGRLIISKVYAGGSAYESGLNANDEIIAIECVRTDTENMKKIMDKFSDREEIKVLVSRSGILKEFKVKLLKPLPKYSIKETAAISVEQKKLLDKWING